MSVNIPILAVTSSLSYCPETGILRWKRSGSGIRGKGAVAGTKSTDKSGKTYIRVGLCGHVVNAHRLAFVLMTGMWPEHQIDHRNGDGTDNRWGNLRRATHSENQKNRRLQKNNKSGQLGIYSPREGKWRVIISVDGKQVSHGTYNSLEDAISVRDAALLANNYAPEHGSRREL
jgi:hypothetical protein